MEVLDLLAGWKKLFVKVWDTENVPKNWVKGIVVIVPKK